MRKMLFTFLLSGILLLVMSLLLSSIYPNNHSCTDVTICSVKATDSSALKLASFDVGVLFDTTGFPPRWSCGEWSAFQGWTSIFSDLLIFLSYFGIPAGLVFFLFKAQPINITYKKLLILFVAFILSCGLTHLIEVVLFWKPMYNLSILMKFITAGISFSTFIALVKTTPQLLKFKSPAQLQNIIDLQTLELKAKNSTLGEEIEERKKIEKDLKSALKLNKELYRENQHRIKNNLQMISSLLYIRSADKDEKDKADYREIGMRVSSISRIHELLLQNGLTTTINVKDYFESLSKELMNIHHIETSLIITIEPELNLNSDSVINCGLIFSEFFSNSVKHAFSETDKPTLTLSMSSTDRNVNMVISDNGSGFDTKVDIDQNSFGIGLMRSFADNMNGQLHISSDESGTKLEVDWEIVK